MAGDRQQGWLCLLGGGEFSFGETEELDDAWLIKAPPGPIGFVPAASGSADYGRHFAAYMKESFDREVETIPIYRDRDARRGRNAERLRSCAAVYLGGGVADQLIDAFAGSPALEALAARLAGGGLVVAIAAAAQACGPAARSVFGGRTIPALALIERAVEPNFDPAHDRRFRQLIAAPGTLGGWGIPAEGALFLGPGGALETVGPVFRLDTTEGDLVPVESQT